MTVQVQQIDLLLTGQYNIAAPGTWKMAQDFGLKNVKQFLGLRIPDETELNAAANSAPGATLLTYAELKKLCINIFDSEKNEMIVNNLPLTSLVIDGQTEINGGSYREIKGCFDFSLSEINVCQALTALPAGQYYSLSIQVYFI